MKRAPWYIVAGAVAGFASVFGLHGRASVPVAMGKSQTAGDATGGQRAPAAQPATSASPGVGSAVPAGQRRSATGSVEQYGYGELSVKVSVAGSQITAVSVPLLRTAEPYSQQIADQVIPMLKSEVLSTHNANIQAISGATYTCEAYAASLQSALDKLHIK